MITRCDRRWPDDALPRLLTLESVEAAALPIQSANLFCDYMVSDERSMIGAQTSE